MKSNLKKRLHDFFSDRTLRGKLLWIYFILLLIPLGLFTFYAFYRISSVVQKQTFTAAQKTFEDTAATVNNQIERLDGVLDILSMDSTIYRVAAMDQINYSYEQRLRDSKQMNTTFQHLKALSNMDRIQLYVHNDYLYTDQQHIIMTTEELEHSNWFLTLEPKTTSYWFAPGDFYDQADAEKHWFSAMRMIYDPSSIISPLAVIRADISEKNILDSISRTSITPNGFFLLLRDQELLLSSNQDIDAHLQDDLISKLPNLATGTWERITSQNKIYYLQYQTLGNNSWLLATILPYDDIFSLSREMREEMLIVVILLGSIAYSLAYAISQSTLKRVSLLTQAMQAVEVGDVTVRPKPMGKDEIGQLTGNFVRMMDRLDTLMEEKVEYGRQIKNLELKALQAQINPHFLYNSLDLISCTAIMHNVPEISTMVNALAKFYKLSLSRGREVITISEELTHARLYLQIQNLRFDNKVNVIWQVEEELLDCQIIKIVLQPILENAIIHGIFEKETKTGTLEMSAFRYEKGIQIVVKDDGVGMEESTLLANFGPTKEEITETTGGYGVRNINDRLHLAYGNDYGLACETTLGKGTTVTISIPEILPDHRG